MPTLKWDIEECIDACRPKFNKRKNKNKLSESDVSFIDIEQSYKIVARIIATYGDKYLPIFERLHREIDKKKSIKHLLDIALNISK